jgi:hypothetical protein
MVVMDDLSGLLNAQKDFKDVEDSREYVISRRRRSMLRENDCPTFRDAMAKSKQALSASGQIPRRLGTRSTWMGRWREWRVP